MGSQSRLLGGCVASATLVLVGCSVFVDLSDLSGGVEPISDAGAGDLDRPERDAIDTDTDTGAPDARGEDGGDVVADADAGLPDGDDGSDADLDAAKSEEAAASDADDVTDVAVNDASVESASDDAGAGETACAAMVGADFCVDFDRPNDLGTPPWTAIDEVDSGYTIALSSTAFSPPHAAELRVLGDGSSCAGPAGLTKGFTGSYTRLTARAMVRPTIASAALPYGESGLLTVILDGSGRYRIIVGLSVMGGTDGFLFALAMDGSSYYGQAQINLSEDPSATFHEVSVELEHDLGAVIRFGTDETSLKALPTSNFWNPAVQFGSSVCLEQAMNVTFDDVAVWLNPGP